MDLLPKFTFCSTLGAYVCNDRRCEVIVFCTNIETHLRRKHKIPAVTAKQQTVKLLNAAEGKSPLKIASRYVEDPFPKTGESPLPALPELPIYDIIKCSFCNIYCNVVSCRAHSRSAHIHHEKYRDCLLAIENSALIKGQALFSVPKRVHFPVSITTSATTHQEQSILFGSFNPEGVGSSDDISLRERNANLSCTILGIPQFLDLQNLSLKGAYDLCKVDDRHNYSKLVGVLSGYIRHFAQMRPAVPLSILNGIRIRDSNTVASFCLTIKNKSKVRYCRTAARFIVLAAKLEQSFLPAFAIDSNIITSAKNILSSLTKDDFCDIRSVHWFFRILLLETVPASEGQIVTIEGLFKILISGYNCDLKSERVRVGDSEDASQTAAALQYFCHIAALGEFFVSPLGFGDKTSEPEEGRIARIQRLLSTNSSTAASYLRTVLSKTKRISAGESPRVEFVQCQNHKLCGSVEKIEVQMNSDNPGSLGYTVRSIARDIEAALRKDLMRSYDIPSDFLRAILSFPDKLNEKDPGYYFGSHGQPANQLKTWGDHFARHLSQVDSPVIQYRSEGNGGEEWLQTKNASEWLHAVDEVSALLYVLVHLCGGGPPHVTEMTEAKMRNTAGSRRNLFIVKQSLAITGSYCKTSRQFEKPKPIARFLDEYNSKLVLLFIVYVKPTQCFLLRKSMSQISATEDYLFCRGGEKVSDDVIRRVFSKALPSRGLPFNVSIYRQYRTGVAKAFLTSGSEEQHTSDQLVFLQSGHSEETAHIRYAGGALSLQDLSLAKLESFNIISQQWHMLLGLDGSHSNFRESNEGGSTKFVEHGDGDIGITRTCDFVLLNCE